MRLGEQTNWEWADGRPATIDYRDPVCAHQGPWAWGPRRRQLHAEYPRASHHRVSLQQLNPQEVEDGIAPRPFRRENPAIEKWKLEERSWPYQTGSLSIKDDRKPQMEAKYRFQGLGLV